MNIAPPIETRRELLGNLLSTYEKRVYDPGYRDALRSLLEADMHQLLHGADFESRIDEHLCAIGIFPAAFEHKSNRKLELRRLLSATFYATNGVGQPWVLQDIHAHGLAAQHGLKSGDALIGINGAEVRAPLTPRVSAHAVSQVKFQNGIRAEDLELNPAVLAAKPANGIGN